MNSQELKVATLLYLLHRKGFIGAVTESWNQADVLGVSRKFLTHEFEIKTSKEDLAKETKAIEFLTGRDTNMRRARGANKIQKHSIYLNSYSPIMYGKDTKMVGHVSPSYFIPNYFSFVVPGGFVDFAKRAVEGTPYGVIRVIQGVVFVEKKAELLHDKKLENSGVFESLRKASVENLNLRERLLGLDKVV